MIVAKNKDAMQYLGMNPYLDAALKRLTEGLDSLEPGHYEMDGKNVWLNCFDYTTIPEEASSYEAHEEYGDIHIMLKGSEKVSISSVDVLKEVLKKPEDDYIQLEGEAEYTLILSPGSFLVVFPDDAHKIKMKVDGPADVRKAVFKFRI